MAKLRFFCTHDYCGGQNDIPKRHLHPSSGNLWLCSHSKRGRNYAPEGGNLRRPPWNSAYHKHPLAYISWVHQAWLHALPSTDCLSRWITNNFTEKTTQTQYSPACLQMPVHTEISLCFLSVIIALYMHPVGNQIMLRANLSVKKLPAMQENRFRSLGWEDPWRRKRQPTPVFLLGEFHGQRSLEDYSPWGHKKSDTTERLTQQQQKIKLQQTLFGALGTGLRSRYWHKSLKWVLISLQFFRW